MTEVRADSPLALPEGRPLWRRPWFIVVVALVMLNIVSMVWGRRHLHRPGLLRS